MEVAEVDAKLVQEKVQVLLHKWEMGVVGDGIHSIRMEEEEEEEGE